MAGGKRKGGTRPTRAEYHRRASIRDMCAAALRPDLVDDYIARGVSVGDVSRKLINLTADAAGPEINGGRSSVPCLERYAALKYRAAADEHVENVLEGHQAGLDGQELTAKIRAAYPGITKRHGFADVGDLYLYLQRCEGLERRALDAPPPVGAPPLDALDPADERVRRLRAAALRFLPPPLIPDPVEQLDEKVAWLVSTGAASNHDVATRMFMRAATNRVPLEFAASQAKIVRQYVGIEIESDRQEFPNALGLPTGDAKAGRRGRGRPTKRSWTHVVVAIETLIRQHAGPRQAHQLTARVVLYFGPLVFAALRKAKDGLGIATTDDVPSLAWLQARVKDTWREHCESKTERTRRANRGNFPTGSKAS